VPRIWFFDCYAVISLRNVSHLGELLQLPRLQGLHRVRLAGVRLDATQLSLIQRCHDLTELQLGAAHDMELDCILEAKAAATARFLTSAETLRLNNSLLTELTERQTAALLKRLARGTARTTSLEVLYNNGLSSLQGERLAAGLCRLTELTLVFQKLSAQQYEALLQAAARPDSALTRLNLPASNLGKVGPGLLGPALARLTRANLADTRLTTRQLAELCAAITHSRLVWLDLSHNNLSSLPPSALLPLARLSSLNLKLTCLTAPQLGCLLSAMDRGTNLHTINLVGLTNLAKLPDPHLLAGVVARLQQVTMYASKLTSSQLEALLLNFITAQKLPLCHIDLGGSNFSAISPSLLAAAATRLESFTLYYCQLTTDQQVALLMAAVSSDHCRLRQLDLAGNNGRLPETLVLQARQRIPNIKLELPKISGQRTSTNWTMQGCY